MQIFMRESTKISSAVDLASVRILFQEYRMTEMMKKFFCSCMAAVMLLGSGSIALAQSEASELSALSLMPLGSVLGSASAVAGSVVAIPAILLVSGGVLVVKSVEASANATVYVLERASDGARVSVEVSAKAAGTASVVVGTAITISVISAGVILQTAGKVLAFIPNEMGRQLLYSQKVSK